MTSPRPRQGELVTASHDRSNRVAALRQATILDLDPDLLLECAHATCATARIGELERSVVALLTHGRPIPADHRGSIQPVLGNIAEAAIEATLVELGWQPVYNDNNASSSGHGVDLLMLDPALDRVVAIEVKSTVQLARWPRLSRPGDSQMSAAWFDKDDNSGMRDWDMRSTDIYAFLCQVRLRQHQWRAVAIGIAGGDQPITSLEDLTDLSWLTATQSEQVQERTER